MAFLDGNSCSYSCNSDKVKKHAYIDPKYLAAQQQKAAATEAWTGLGISLFLSLTGSVIQGIENGDFKSSSGVEVEDRTVAEIEADIQKILDEVECTTIQDAEALLESKKLERKGADKEVGEIEGKLGQLAQNIPASEQKIASLKDANTTLLATNKNLTTQWESLDSKIRAWSGLEGHEEIIKGLEEQKAGINKQIEENNRKYNENKKAIELEERLLDTYKKSEKIYNRKLEDLKETTIPELDKSIENIEGHIKNLHKLDKQLKKAEKEEAKDSLKNNLNDDTKQISDIIKKLNNANSNGWDKKASKHDADAREAIVNYYQNHNEGDNTTIDRLAKTMGFDFATEKFKDKK